MALTGCTDEGDFKEILGCAIAVDQLQQCAAPQKINAYMGKLLKETGYRPSVMAMLRIREELMYDDWNLAGMGTLGQLETFLDEFNSCTWQDIYRQGDLSRRDLL
ncbi:hypothetical protein [Pseudomonas sp. B1-22]|uniref:hypothetical protein n=1 Tax=Pseudomonas sp. B1-22 TaxID=3141456 RepID=UPI003D2DF25C